MTGARKLVALFALLIAALAAIPAAAQGARNHIAAELVAETPLEPGKTMTVALVFRPEEGWHGYWSNPGDAGYGMSLDWRLPAGWSAGEPEYPVPEKLLISGLMNHVYEGEYAVLVPLEVPASAAVANLAPITVDAQWLACTDTICVPEAATLQLRFPAMALTERFDAYRAAIPPLLDTKARFDFAGDRLRIAIPLPASMALADPHVFLGQDKVVDYAAVQTFSRVGNALVAEIPQAQQQAEPGKLSGIIALDGQRDGLRFEAVPGDVPVGGQRIGASEEPLWLLIGGALLGGLLLNLMPCVFPILSLKALTLARAGESGASARREALSYTAGVVLACLALGALVLVLRAGGEQIGWAFQLQEPGVVAALLVLALLITANLAGLYELPSLSITRAGGKASSFATGLLAAFVATPCTGPFMAAALGAALLLPPTQAMVLFGALGLGLALPFLLLGFVPALRRWLPRPGGWMDGFRKLMAVPMGLTALGLVWLCWRLGGAGFATGAVVLGAVLVFWMMASVRRSGLAALAGVVMATGLGAQFLPQLISHDAMAAGSILPTEAFSPQALAEARASGRPVFLYFTADWCLTCKVNEEVAIEREATRAAFERAGVTVLRGDWTRRDAEIGRFLSEQGVAGVPLYLWYAPGGEAEVLPQVLTPGLLAEKAGG